MAKKLRVSKLKLEERFSEQKIPGAFDEWYQTVTNDFSPACKWNAALGAAKEAKLISEAEYKATYLYRPFTLKQYLWTRVRDPELRELLKQHAIDASMAARRGSIIMNLLVQQELDRGGENAAADMLKMLLDNQTFVKQCFLPEKWIRSTHARATPVDARVLQVLQQHAEQLRCLLPDWKARGDAGWDNITGFLQGKFVTNLRQHVSIHLFHRVVKYLRWVTQDSDMAIASFFEGSGIPDGPDGAIVQQLRSILGVPLGRPIEKEIEHVKVHHLRLHVYLISHKPHGMKRFSFCPVASLRRQYCRIDERVLSALLRTTGLKHISFQKCFGMDQSEHRQRTKELRRKLRKKLMARATNAEEKRRLRKRCQHLQSGRVPEGIVTSIETDGYGLSTFLQIPVPPERDNVENNGRMKIGEEPARGKRLSERYSEDLMRFQSHIAGIVQDHPSPLLKGLDPGAVNMFHSVFEDESGHAVFFKVDRERLAHDSGRRAYETYEKQCQEENVALQQALSEMSQGSMKSSRLDDMNRFLEAQRTHWGMLEQEYLVADKYPKLRMWMYRKKRSSLDKYANRLLFEGRCQQKADGQVVKDLERPVLIGYGGGKFDPSCGRYSVPTKAMKEAVDRGFKRFKRERKNGGMSILSGGVVIINEYFTTKKCAACRCFLQKGRRLTVPLDFW
jgi:hypothetical protein